MFNGFALNGQSHVLEALQSSETLLHRLRTESVNPSKYIMHSVVGGDWEVVFFIKINVATSLLHVTFIIIKV